MLFGIPLELIVYVLAGLVVLLAIWVVHLEIRLKRLLRGKSGASLEDAITTIGRDLAGMATYRKNLDEYLEDVESRLRKSVQGVSTVRFNPFPDKGGNHSFATAFLNEHGDGVVLSALAAREKVSIFAKPVKNFTSDFQLTDEEKQAIEQAKH